MALAPADSDVPAGSFAMWRGPPDTEAGFIKWFVLATWWVGAVLGGVWLWRRGGRPADVLCGAVAGAVAGLIGMATLAAVWPILDLPARLLWALMGSARSGSAWVWTPLWVLTVSATWALAGGTLAACGLAARQTINRESTV